jgi:putative DNA primase/helicase
MAHNIGGTPSARQAKQPGKGQYSQMKKYTTTPPPSIELTHADEVEPEAVTWMWTEWLQRRAFNLLAGPSTAGKSTIALSFCATSTRGGFWPDGQPCQPGHAIYWSGEDGIKDTLLPRFIAAGGDRAGMHFISGIREGERKRSFNPAVDMPALQSTVERLKNVNLIVLDPVAVVVRGDSHKNVETRVGMQPFSDMCLQCGACGLGIHHLTKNTKGRTLLERVSGSLAFHAAPRAVLMAMEHQTDRGRRVVVRAKVSNGPEGSGFEYQMAPGPLKGYPDIRTLHLSWGDPVEGSAWEILDEFETREDEDEEGHNRAETFVAGALADGPMLAAEVYAKGKKVDIPARTLRRAFRKLGGVPERKGFQGLVTWELKTAENTDKRNNSKFRFVDGRLEPILSKKH